ncbi:hypothetical protein MBANPS3_008940 [Mucor bainieri]
MFAVHAFAPWTHASDEEDIEDLQADTTTSPLTLPVPSAPAEPLFSSPKDLVQHISLPDVDSQVAHNVLTSLGFQTVSYGSGDGGVQLPFYSSNNAIKGAITLQEEHQSKKLKMTPCIVP